MTLPLRILTPKDIAELRAKAAKKIKLAVSPLIDPTAQSDATAVTLPSRQPLRTIGPQTESGNRLQQIAANEGKTGLPAVDKVLDKTPGLAKSFITSGIETSQQLHEGKYGQAAISIATNTLPAGGLEIPKLAGLAVGALRVAKTAGVVDEAAKVVTARPIADAMRKIFAPATRSLEAAQTGHIIRANAAAMAHNNELARESLKGFSKTFNALSATDRLSFIDNMEKGLPHASPELNAAAGQMRKMLDTQRDAIRALGTGKLEHFIQDYFPHIWEDPDKVGSAIARVLGKRPLQGPASFLKQRSIPTTADGIALGLKPVTDNPVDLTLLKLREMNRYLMGQKIIGEMKEGNLVKFVRAGEMSPEGYARIDDKIAKVIGPRTGGVTLPKGATVPSESVTRKTVSLLDENGRVRRSLKDVPDEHLQDEWRRLSELNAEEEGLHASVQESGYRATYEELPRTERLGKKGQKDLPDADSAIDPDRLVSDNKIIADYNRSQGVRKAREKTMKRIEAEMARRPSANDFSFGDESNAGKVALRPEDVSVPGMRIMGEYHAPESVATVLNNFLSPGLRGNALYDSYMGVGNVLNQAQLGLSAFHLGFTSMDAAVSKMALGVEQLASGKPLQALKSAAQVPTAPFTNYLQGSKVLREYLKPGSQGGEMAAIVNGLVEGGGRVRMDTFYKNNAIEGFRKAIHEKHFITAGVKALPAALELASKPLMEHIVPRQKLGVFADLARHELSKLPEGATTEQVRKVMADVWDSVDNRMGQLVYDNLFWNKTVKDLSMASVRSLGWNLGTIRELGGGAVDLAKLPVSRNLTHKSAYAISLPITVGMAGAVLQYLYSGQGPQELKDYFYPKTGRKNDSGDDERVQLPSYVKDVAAYSQHPWRTVKHKLHPMIGTIGDMLENQDFYGDMIRNPEDPAVQQLKQEAEYIAKAWTPLGIRNVLEESRRDQPLAVRAGAMVGITPAPRTSVRTDAGNKIAEYSARHVPATRTPEEARKADLRREIMKSARSGEPPSDELREKVKAAMAEDLIRREDILRVLKAAQTPPSVAGFKRLPLADAVEAFKIATPQEKRLWKGPLAKKIRREATDASR